MSKYQWVRVSETEKFYNVGILPDGALWNPNGYPEDVVRSAVIAADQRKKERRSRAAKKAAATREIRRGQKVYRIAQLIVDGRSIGPRHRCAICSKRLADNQSIERGIGAECWQGLLWIIESAGGAGR
jgi:hypothetical protein